VFRIQAIMLNSSRSLRRTSAIMGGGYHEHQKLNVFPGLRGRPGRFSPLRYHDGRAPIGSTLNDCTPGTSVSQAIKSESESARTKAESQAFRFPRPSRLASFSVNRRFAVWNLAGESRIGKPLAHDLRNRKLEAVGVVHVLSVVISKALLIQILGRHAPRSPSRVPCPSDQVR